MKVVDLQDSIPKQVYDIIEAQGFAEFRPCQFKSIQAGLFDFESILVCTPTGSGKTQVAEYAFLHSILSKTGKAIYLVPLKALANEKYNDFTKKYPNIKIAKSIGDKDASDNYLMNYELIITTAEKLDSLIRHHAPWLSQVKTIIVDEIHLLNDSHRGPTLEIVITILRKLLTNIQIIGLSATIGNPKELADWLQAKLVEDSWRPVELQKGIFLDGKIEIYK